MTIACSRDQHCHTVIRGSREHPLLGPASDDREPHLSMRKLPDRAGAPHYSPHKARPPGGSAKARNGARRPPSRPPPACRWPPDGHRGQTTRKPAKFPRIEPIRDFKPDNVLLSRDPGSGELRAQVADFGLARRDDEVLEPSEPGESEVVLVSRHSLLDDGLTRVGAVIGTPAYMSPEQHAGASVDARSDQFSFCVALWEALYGERPFHGDTIEALALAVNLPRRPPPPPGSAVPGWLHRVCVRGLAADRDARFASMDALLAEVARRRVQGRNGWLLGAGAAALAGVLVVGLVGREQPAAPPVQRCTGGPARLVGVWDAEVQARAERAFMASGAVYAADAWALARRQVDEYSAAWLAMHRDSCEATQLRGEQSEALMDLRMACLAGRLQDLGALTRLYAAADVQVVKRSVDMGVALPPLDGCADATALREREAPAPEQAGAVEAVRATLAEARSLRSAGKHKDALALARAAVERATALGHGTLQAEAQLALGHVQVVAGEHEAAIATLTAGVAEALRGRDDAALLDGLIALLDVVGYNLGRHKEASGWSALAQGALVRAGQRPRDEARVLLSQGLVDFGASRLPEAEAKLLRCVALREGLFGPEHPSLSGPVNGLGAVYLRTGRYEEAEATFTRAVALAERAGGPNHPDVGLPLNNLALSFERQGRHAEAIAALRRAQALFERTLGPDHPNVGVLRQNIAGMLRLSGETAAARLEIDAASALLTAKLGPEHPAIGGVLTFSGDIALDERDLPRARADYLRADELRRKVLGEAHPDRALALLGLGKLALLEDRPAEAVVHLELALELLAATAPDPVDLGEVRFALARALWATGVTRRASALAGEARESLAEGGVNARAQLRALDVWRAGHAYP